MLRKYEMELDELKHPLMVEESSYECPDERLNSSEKIVKLLNECFRLDKKAGQALAPVPAVAILPKEEGGQLNGF